MAIFIENREDKVFYEEIREFSQHENLVINDSPIDKPLISTLSPGEHKLHMLHLAPNKLEYHYKYSTKFKIFGFDSL